MNDQVILVNEKDQPIGVAEKLEAHRKNLLHRAFSIFIFNSEGKCLLQKRSKSKYHSAGLWSNTCCGHPRPGEDITTAAHRRLKEEMGFDCDLEKVSQFIYQVTFPDQLFEHEIDHIFIGNYTRNPSPDPKEVNEWKWHSFELIKEDLKENPGSFSYWFSIAFEKVKNLGEVASSGV